MPQDDAKRILRNFNEGFDAYKRARVQIQREQFADYEQSLLSAARQTGLALEWALKSHLRHYKRSKRMDPDHYRLLRQPNFDDLVKLMQLYGDPALDDEMANAFFSYRDMRNAAEHHGTIPSFSALAGALADVRDTILHLLDLDETQLPPIDRLAEIGIDDKIDLNESPSVLETHRIRDSSEVEFLQFEELHEKSFPDPTIRDWS